MVALEEENAKAPGEIVIQAELPRLAPNAHAAKAPAKGQPATDQAPADKTAPPAEQPVDEHK